MNRGEGARFVHLCTVLLLLSCAVVALAQEDVDLNQYYLEQFYYQLE